MDGRVNASGPDAYGNAWFFIPKSSSQSRYPEVKCCPPTIRNIAGPSAVYSCVAAPLNREDDLSTFENPRDCCS
jgi:hypothetical protein